MPYYREYYCKSGWKVVNSCLQIKTMQSLKNYVHCYLSQSRNFGISVFCCESRHQADVKNFTAISFSGYLTFLVILAVPNNADFWRCSILISISRLSIYFSNFVLIVLDAPTTMGITTTFFVCHNLETSHISQSFLFLYHILLFIFPGISTSVIIIIIDIITYFVQRNWFLEFVQYYAFNSKL